MFRRSRAIVVLAVLVATAVAWMARESWLASIGRFLIETDQLVKADIVVVLAGDGYGRRVMKAADLVAKGYAPKILVNGAARFYDTDESKAAVEFAVQRGVPPEILDPFFLEADSTLEEMGLLEAELRRRGVKTALVVTSDFHTRRARSIFRKFGSGEIAYAFVAAPWPDFDPDAWWRTRRGQKTVLLEYLKTVNSFFEAPAQ